MDLSVFESYNKTKTFLKKEQIRSDYPSHHEDEENKEDKGGEVDRSQHRVGLLYF